MSRGLVLCQRDNASMEVKARMEVPSMSGEQRPRATRRIKAGRLRRTKSGICPPDPIGDELRELRLEIGRRAEAAGLTEEDVEREVEEYRAGR